MNSPGNQEEAAMVTVLTIGYRARCTERGCGNLARAILRYADRSRRPLSNLERCNTHTREALERDATLTLNDD
jgi:hypothetical protein